MRQPFNRFVQGPKTNILHSSPYTHLKVGWTQQPNTESTNKLNLKPWNDQMFTLNGFSKNKQKTKTKKKHWKSRSKKKIKNDLIFPRVTKRKKLNNFCTTSKPTIYFTFCCCFSFSQSIPKQTKNRNKMAQKYKKDFCFPPQCWRKGHFSKICFFKSVYK